jgi:hypothetical protein
VDIQPIFSLEDFLAETSPKGKRSKLAPFAGEIDRAIAMGLSYDQIVAWLARNNVKISKSAVNQWVHRRAAQGHVSPLNNGQAVEVVPLKPVLSECILPGSDRALAPASAVVPTSSSVEVVDVRRGTIISKAQVNLPNGKPGIAHLSRDEPIKGLMQVYQELLEDEKGEDLSRYRQIGNHKPE